MKIVFIASVALVSSMLISCTAPTSTPTSSLPAQPSEQMVATNMLSDVAYIDVDMVLAESEIFKTEGVALQKKTEKSQASLSQREQNLQSEAAKLQEKYQRGLITTANAQLEQEKIQQKVVEFQNSAQTEVRKLEEENVVFSNRTRDLIRRAVDVINGDKRYKLIVNAASLIDADTTLNITANVIEVVNKLYADDQAEAKR